MTEKIPCNLPEGVPLRMEGDPVSMFNIRTWLEKAIAAKGAEVTGKGVGNNEADLDFTLEGCKFNVIVRPRGLSND